MTKLKIYRSINYKSKEYVICMIKHLSNDIPILLDKDIYNKLRKLNYEYYINEKNHVFTNIKNKTCYLHQLVMKLDDNDYKKEKIYHINKIHFDNRKENLQYGDDKKNIKKKSRIINLSRQKIKSEKLPTYLFYVKKDKTHGERFQVEIKKEKILWRSSSSKLLSLKYKLEESKKYLRYSFNLNGLNLGLNS